jgi:hypothetical protein
VPHRLELRSALEGRTVTLFRSHYEADDGGFMPGSADERLAQVWELARDAWLFFDPTLDAEQRLERDVAVLVRRGR